MKWTYQAVPELTYDLAARQEQADQNMAPRERFLTTIQTEAVLNALEENPKPQVTI